MPQMTDKDRNNLWAQMPPVRKPDAKPPRQINRPPEEEPAPTNKKDGKKQSSKEPKENKLGAKRQAAKKMAAEDRREKRRAEKTQAPDINKAAKESKEAENAAPPAENAPPQAKPVNIQDRALRRKKKGEAVGRSQSITYPKNRRERLSKYSIYYVMVITAAVVIFCILSVTVLFNADNFEITGDAAYTKEDVMAVCGIEKGENLIRLDSAAAERRILAALPFVDKVKVHKKLPSTVEIALTQAVPVANVQKNKNYYLVSSNGRILDATLTSPEKGYVLVKGFDPEYAVSGDFISVTSEGGRNLICKLLSSVKQYDGLSIGDTGEAELKYNALFELIAICGDIGLMDKIRYIDISNIYNIKLNYDKRLILELGDTNGLRLKLTVGKNLIDKGEFDGESGHLILSQITDSYDSMKATFRPLYDESGDDLTIGDTDKPPTESRR